MEPAEGSSHRMGKRRPEDQAAEPAPKRPADRAKSAASRTPPAPKKAALKDINRPKRPTTGFDLWLQDNRLEIGQALGSGKSALVRPEAARRWRALSEEEKDPYTRKANKGKVKYKARLEDYKQTEQYSSHREKLEEAKRAVKLEAPKKSVVKLEPGSEAVNLPISAASGIDLSGVPSQALLDEIARRLKRAEPPAEEAAGRAQEEKQEQDPQAEAQPEAESEAAEATRSTPGFKMWFNARKEKFQQEMCAVPALAISLEGQLRWANLSESKKASWEAKASAQA
jgi:hypothetical protein